MTKIWTNEEIEILTNNYPLFGGIYCANKLNRTRKSVSAKAERLKLRAPKVIKTKTHEEYELELFNKEIDVFPIEKYVTAKTSILHECIKQHQWLINPNDVLTGYGCPYCAGNNLKTHQTYVEEIASKGFKVLETYINAKTPILHECSKEHQWKARPRDILSNKGCPSCANHGFNPNKPAILYYIKITKDNEIYYKIGVTNNTISKRFEKDKDKIFEVIFIKSFDKGLDAINEEQKLLHKYDEHRQSMKGWLKSRGNTELFEFDVLKLENVN